MLPLFRRLRARLKYRNFDRDLARELEVHRAMKQEDLEANGAVSADARSASIRGLGNMTLMREEARGVWIGRWIEQGLQDLRYAARGFRRQPAFNMGSVVTLGAALGLLFSVFAVYNALHLRPWDIRDPEAVFSVVGLQQSSPRPRTGFSLASVTRLSGGIRTATLAVHDDASFTIAHADGQEAQASGDWVSHNFIDVLRIRLQRGSGFAAGSRAAEIIVSHRFWQETLGGRPDVVGSVIQVNKVPVTVAGVIEPQFTGLTPRKIDVMLNLAGRSAWPGAPFECCVQIVGRLAPGATIAAAEAELRAVGAPLLSEPDRLVHTAALTDTTMRGRGELRRELPRVFALLFSAAGLVLVLAAANVGNLHLARGLKRQRELAIRLAIGATRGRVVRQLVIESLSQTAIAAVAGLALAIYLPRAVLSFDRTEGVYALEPDLRTYLFVAVSAVFTCALFAVAPALRVTRRDARGGLSTVAQGAGRLRSITLATQIAISATLVIAATLLVRGVVTAAGSDGGFALHDIRTAIIIRPQGYNSARTSALSAHLEQNLGAAGHHFGFTEVTPFSPLVITAQPAGGPPVRVMPMSAGSFGVLGVSIIEGRPYSDDPSAGEIVVNEALARTLWPGVGAVGQSLDGRTVVGVASNAQLVAIGDDRPLVFRAVKRGGLPFLTYRKGEAETRLREVLRQFDPRLEVRIADLSASVMDQLRVSIAGASVAGGMGVLALLLAVIGVFGVCAFLVEERRREIGIRLALGARRSDVRRSIVHAARWPLAGGLTAGLVLAVFAGFLLRNFLIGVSPVDPVTYAIVGGLMAVAAAIATWIPFRRAVRVDPAITLRHD